MGRGKRRASGVRTHAQPRELIEALRLEPHWQELWQRLALLSDQREPGAVMSEREITRYAHTLLRAAGLKRDGVLVIEMDRDQIELAVTLYEEALRIGAKKVRFLADLGLGGALPAEVDSRQNVNAWREVIADNALLLTINEPPVWPEANAGDWLRAEKKNRVRWTLIFWPTEELAELSYGGVGIAERRGLADDLLCFTRCTQEDSLDALEQHFAYLRCRAKTLNSLDLDSITVSDESGTEVEFGLFDSSEWRPVEWETASGDLCRCNIPSEEVFCTPDHWRTRGRFKTTRPCWLTVANPSDPESRTWIVVSSIEGEFVHGTLKRKNFIVDPPELTDLIFQELNQEAARLRVGEIALVGSDSRVSRARRAFGIDIIDENSGSHFALGDSFSTGLAEGSRKQGNCTDSFFHLDLTIGGCEQVTGKTRAGESVALMIEGQWQI